MKYLLSATLMLFLLGSRCDDYQSDIAPSETMPGESPTEVGVETAYFARAEIDSLDDSAIDGRITFAKGDGQSMEVMISLTGLEPGSEHGVHIHENGDCGDKGKAAGGHFNPTKTEHGGPHEADSHVGDFGNVQANENGQAEMTITKAIPKEGFDGGDSILGKAVIVHAGKDDLTSQPSGNSGDRIGCGIIEKYQATAE